MNSSETLNTMLWLYRRLPHIYGRPPFIEAVINSLAKEAGVDVAESLAERGNTETVEREVEKCKKMLTEQDVATKREFQERLNGMINEIRNALKHNA
jgi:hypothetical protein